MSSVKIGPKTVGDGYQCFVVAEIGINHNGSLEIAKQLVDVAVEAGCDAVKFQKRTIEIVYSEKDRNQLRKVDSSIIRNAMRRRTIEGIEYPVLPESSLQRLETDVSNTTNGDLKYSLEFGLKEYDVIDRYCQERNIIWFASCWDGLSIHFINGYNVPCHKIASACLTHADLLRRARYKGKPVILSTGGSTMEQIKKAVEILGQEDLIILHCTANYPCLDEEINLNVINTLKEKFPMVPIGYSGHEVDITPSIIAAKMGACLVERHITLDKNMPGSDHKASLKPVELKNLVFAIRHPRPWSKHISKNRLNVLNGNGVKQVYPSEVSVMKKLRRVENF